MNKTVYDLLLKLEDCDDFHNRCDYLIEHDEITYLLEYIKAKDKEIDRLKKENNDLRKLYQRTYKHLFDIGKDELASYLQAQIDECPTFYVEPIVDYYEEYKRLNNIIKDIKDYVNFLVIINQTINGKFNETQWGQDILELIGDDNE